MLWENVLVPYLHANDVWLLPFYTKQQKDMLKNVLFCWTTTGRHHPLLFGKRRYPHWKLRIIMMSTLSSLVTPKVVVVCAQSWHHEDFVFQCPFLLDMFHSSLTFWTLTKFWTMHGCLISAEALPQIVKLFYDISDIWYLPLKFPCRFHEQEF